MIKLGRNAPCHCGSGKKYKKCCMNKDEGLVAGSNNESLQDLLASLPGGLMDDFPTELLEEFENSEDFNVEKDNLLFPQTELMRQMHEKFEKFSGGKEFSSIEEFNAKMEEFSEFHNHTGLDQFLGLSPEQIFTFRSNNIFEKGSGLELNDKLPLIIVENTPVIKFCEFILNYIYDAGKIKATAVKQNFPRKLSQGYMELFINELNEDDSWKNIYSNQNIQSEDDAPHLFTLKYMLTSCGWLKLRRGYFSLTKNGTHLVEKGFTFAAFCELLTFYVRNFNWGYKDLYPELFDIQHNAYFLLYIIYKRADEWISFVEIGKAMLKAFPMLEDEISYAKNVERIICSICKVRFINQFCFLFGLLETEERPDSTGMSSDQETFCRKTKLFKELFVWSV